MSYATRCWCDNNKKSERRELEWIEYAMQDLTLNGATPTMALFSPKAKGNAYLRLGVSNAPLPPINRDIEYVFTQLRWLIFNIYYAVSHS